METIGERLKRLRLARDLTQKQLGELAGVAQSTISGVEKGERQIKPSSLIELAHALKAEAYYLKYGKGIADLDRAQPPELREITTAFYLIDDAVKDIWLSSARSALKKADAEKRKAA